MIEHHYRLEELRRCELQNGILLSGAVILSACLSFLVSASISKVTETVGWIGDLWLEGSRLLRLPYGVLRFYNVLSGLAGLGIDSCSPHFPAMILNSQWSIPTLIRIYGAYVRISIGNDNEGELALNIVCYVCVRGFLLMF